MGGSTTLTGPTSGERQNSSKISSFAGNRETTGDFSEKYDSSRTLQKKKNAAGHQANFVARSVKNSGRC